MKTEAQITKEIYDIAKEFSQTKQKPLISILQPRRSLKETPAQQLQDWRNRMVDVTSVAVSYHAIDGNPVDSARCWLIDQALEDDAKYAMFIDEDTALPYYGIGNLIETSKKYPDSIIVGIYYVKFGNVMMSVMDEEKRWVLPDVTPNSGVVRNIVSSGLGCALIPMHLIKKIKAKFEDIPLFCIVPDKCWKDPDVTFIGEDAWFFNLARKCGIETIADTSVQCLHMELRTGKYTSHPDVNLTDYLTNMPVKERFTMEDRFRVSKDYMDRICKPAFGEDIPSAWKGHEIFAGKLVTKVNPEVIVDLGVDYGYSTIAFAIPGIGRVYGVDHFKGDEQTGYRDTKDQCMLNIAKNGCNNVELITGDFIEVAKTWTKPIDILHIDGAHDYESTKSAYSAWIKHLKPEGFVLFHDVVAFEGVRKFFDELNGNKHIFENSAGLGVVSDRDLTGYIN